MTAISPATWGRLSERCAWRRRLVVGAFIFASCWLTANGVAVSAVTVTVGKVTPSTVPSGPLGSKIDGTTDPSSVGKPVPSPQVAPGMSLNGTSSTNALASPSSSLVSGGVAAAAAAGLPTPVRETPGDGAYVTTPAGGTPVAYLSTPLTNASAGAGGYYQYWVGLAAGYTPVPPAFTGTYWSASSPNRSVATPFWANGTYYWKTQYCTSALGCSATQTTDRKFHVIIAPGIASPAEGAVTAAPSVRLQVQDAASISGVSWNHKFILSTNPNVQNDPFGAGFISQHDVGQQPFVDVTLPPAGQTLFWTAQTCYNIGDGCSIRAFRGAITRISVPSTTLVSPAKAEVVSPTGRLTAAPVSVTVTPGGPPAPPVNYALQVSDTPDFSGWTRGSAAWQTSPAFDIPASWGLRNGQLIYWRVKTHAAGIDGGWSPINRFWVGEAPRPKVYGATVRVSQTATGQAAGGENPFVSANGRFVTFRSAASNLVSGDTNGLMDVFVVDRAQGTTERVSVGPNGAQADGASMSGGITPDGRYVVFTSTATNLVSGDNNGTTDVFVFDLTTRATERVSIADNEAQANGGSHLKVSISANGRYVAFSGSANNLVTGDSNNIDDAFVRDRTAGTTERVSVDSLEAQSSAGTWTSDVVMTPDGRYVAFDSTATGLVANDTNAEFDVFVRDRTSGTTDRASLTAAGGQIPGHSAHPAISNDGRYVVFHSNIDAIVAGDSNGIWDSYVRDRTGNTTRRISNVGGIAGNNLSFFPSISGDGAYATFISASSNLVPADSNGRYDMFRTELATGKVERVSMSSDNDEGTGTTDSGGGSLSADGRFVVYQSHLNGLVSADTAGESDVFLSDMKIQRTQPITLGVPDGLNLGTCDNSLGATEAVGCSNAVANAAEEPAISEDSEYDEAGDDSAFADDPGYEGEGLEDATTESNVEGYVAPVADLGASNADPGLNSDDAVQGYTTSATDVSLPGIGIPFRLTRTYNSANSDATVASADLGPLGRGWSHTVGARLKVWPDVGDVTVYGEDGQRAMFFWDGSEFKPAPGATSRLTLSGGLYTLKAGDLTTQVFDGNGRLIRWRDAFSQGLTITYVGATPQIATVIASTGPDTAGGPDRAGRVITFTYTGDRLTRVVLPNVNAQAREIQFAYTDNLLTSVTDTGGLTTTYSYEPSGDRRLLTVADPGGQVHNTISYAPTGESVVGQAQAGEPQVTYETSTLNGVLISKRKEPATATTPERVWTTETINGVVMSETDPAGNKRRYGYDSQLNRVLVVDANGHETRYAYDELGNRTEMMGPAPFTYPESATYDTTSTSPSRGKLVSATNRAGVPTITNLYDGATGVLRQSANGLGKLRVYTYNARGELITERDERLKTTRYEYDLATGDRLKVISPLGLVTRSEYDAAGRLIAEYDARTPAVTTDFKTTYVYDRSDRVTRTIDKRGNTADTVYDAEGRVSKTIDARGVETSYVYDAYDRVVETRTPVDATRVAVTRTEYDPFGRVVATIAADGGKTSYEYDPAGRQRTRITPRGNLSGAVTANFRWTTEYDPNGNVIHETTPATAQNSSGNTTTTDYDQLNREISQTNPLGKKTRMGYDAVGNVLSETDRLGNTTRYEYDALNRKTATITPRGKRSTIAYDDTGNVIETVSATGAKTTLTYDDDGRQVSKVEPRGYVAPNTPAQFTWTYGYDEVGNQTRVTDPVGAAATPAYNVMSTTYDGENNKLTETNGRGNTTSFTYDQLNRIASVTGADATTCTAGPVQCVNGKSSAVYAYDFAGNITRRTDPLGRATNSTYDLMGRLTETLNPIGNKVTHEYDLEGNQRTTVTARGNASSTPATGTITRAFDGRSLNTGITYGDGVTPNVTFAYDNAGQLVSMTDGAGTESYELDDAGRVKKVTRGSESFNYVYDADGNVTSRQFPDTSTHTATFDNDGRIESITSGGTTTTFGYDAASNLTRTTLPASNGHVENRVYDRAGRLATVESVKGTNVLVRVNQTLDPVGNPTLSATTRGTTTTNETYSYDPAERITRNCPNITTACTATAAQRIGYTYDLVGNRLTQERIGVATPGNTVYQYNPADQLLLSSTGAAGSVPGLVASYNFDEGTGTTLTDRSGTGNNGALAGGAAWAPAAGKNGGGLIFDGVDDSVSIPGTTPLDLRAGVTVSAWVKRTKNNAYQVILGKPGDGQSKNENYALWFDSSNRPTAYFGNGTSFVSVASAALDSNWHHIAATYDNATARLYIDGVQTASATSAVQLTSRAGALSLGKSAANTFSFGGTLDDVRVLNRVLTQAEVTAQSTTPVAATTADVSTAFAYDADGNQTASGSERSVYDLGNRLVRFCPGAVTCTAAATGRTDYTYDGVGKRLTRQTNGAVDTRFSWDSLDQLPELALERNGANALIGRYVQGPNGPVSLATATGAVYYHRDPIGSIRGLSNATGASQWIYDYEPFGEGRLTTKVATSAPSNAVLFAGEALDTETGLYHLRARQYAPTKGMFLSLDPLPCAAAQPSMTSYAYSNGRPTVLTDPSGQRAVPYAASTSLESCHNARWQITSDKNREPMGSLVTFQDRKRSLFISPRIAGKSKTYAQKSTTWKWTLQAWHGDARSYDAAENNDRLVNQTNGTKSKKRYPPHSDRNGFESPRWRTGAIVNIKVKGNGIYPSGRNRITWRVDWRVRRCIYY